MADCLHNMSRSPVGHRPASPTHSSESIYEYIDIVEDALRKHIDNEAAAPSELWEDMRQELENVQQELQKVKEKQQLDHERTDTEISLLWKSLASARAYMTDMLDMMERRTHRFSKQKSADMASSPATDSMSSLAPATPPTPPDYHRTRNQQPCLGLTSIRPTV